MRKKEVRALNSKLKKIRILNSKRSFEFSFAWLFAIVIGAFILFLAIYGVVKLIGTSRYQIDTVTAKQLSIIFEPMETGLASGKSSIAHLREDTRIYNNCFDGGNFGKQRFSLSTKQGIGGWSERGGEIAVPNKYIFSQEIEQGKTIYFFSKPFEMPWKVSEIIFLTTRKYCFVNAPEDVEDEVRGLNLQNIKLKNCSNEIKVCFNSGSDCDIKVTGSCVGYDCDFEYDYGSVEKEGKTLIYTGSLLYGAIFSSSDIYDCNVKRLMKRLKQQALIFKDEAGFLSVKCGTLPSSGLLQIVNFPFDSSKDLLLFRQIARQIENENDAANCKLW